MHNALFSPAALSVLLAPATWTVFSAAFPRRVSPWRDAAYERWARTHTEQHANREVLIVLEGKGTQFVGGTLCPAQPGSVFLYDAMEPHARGYPSGHPSARHLWMVFVQDRCVVMGIEIGRGQKGYRETWRRLYGLQELGLASPDLLFPKVSDASNQQAANRVQVTAAVTLLVSRLVAQGYASPTAEASRDFRGNVIAAIRRHVQESNGRGCRMQDLARIAGYSPFHFHRIFREHVGMTPGQYVAHCRREAFRRLAASGLRHKAMAESLGFAHPSALTRWRKRQARSGGGTRGPRQTG